MLCKRVLNIIKQAMAKDIKIKDLELISEEEKETILAEFNDTTAEFPKDKTVVEIFEERAAKTPDKTALIYEGEKITYKELNERANQVAHLLRQKNIGREDRVALLCQRGIEMVIGIYGIIKAGAAYVPIDPEYPQDRIDYIFENSNSKAALVYKIQIKTELPVFDLSVPNLYEGLPKENPERLNKPQDLLYVIYTSGTTGKPKGVMIEHGNVVSLRQSYIDDMDFSEEDTLIQFASICFDQSVGDILVGLMTGTTLCIASDKIRKDPQAIESYINKHSVTFGSFTPKVAQELNPEVLPSLRAMDSGGEAGYLNNLQKWSLYCRVFNTYGPTEATVNASIMEIFPKTEKLRHCL